MIKIYNSLSKEKEILKTIKEKEVKMYLCGPTVYNYIHIGNARPAVFFDTVRKYLKYKGYKVNYVSNFTDVDDKIINKAKELNIEVSDLTEKFIKAYKEDIKDLGCDEADFNPTVSENMDNIIKFIEDLIEKGYAYEINGDVYFEVEKFESYGQLSNQSIESLIEANRIDINEIKKNQKDFALWKNAKPGEISWKTNWGYGRPGWHIECSSMIKETLGETIDIHAGGIDLTFPHHENEIAQSEALNEKKLANYWMHNGHINIDNKKMSKSLGNIIIVNELKKKIDPLTIRLLLLSTHYRQPINYGTEILEEVNNSLQKIKNSYNNLKFALKETVYNENYEIKNDELKKSLIEFEKSMNDDFNTSNAITELYKLINYINNKISDDNINKDTLVQSMILLNIMLDILGLDTIKKEVSNEEEILLLIEKRNKAKKEKNFELSDSIREELLSKGIILEDTREGTRWIKK